MFENKQTINVDYLQNHLKQVTPNHINNDTYFSNNYSFIENDLKL